MAWKVVPRYAGLGATQKTVTVFRDSKGWRLFLPKSIRIKFGEPEFVDLYADGYKLQLKIPQKKESYTRHLTNGSVRLPLVKLGIKMEGGIIRVDVLPEIKEDELIIDLEQYKEKDF